MTLKSLLNLLIIPLVLAAFIGGFIISRELASPPETTAQTESGNLLACGQKLAEYMNAVIEGASGLSGIRITSPVFNITNPKEYEILKAMETAGANFAEIDSFAGNTYTLNSNSALFYYRDNPFADWDTTFSSYGKPVIFTEFGDIDGNSGPGSRSAAVLERMTSEFNSASGSLDIQAVIYFNALEGTNTDPRWEPFILTSSDFNQIISSNPTKGGVNSASGISGATFSSRVNEYSPNAGWSLEIINGPGDIEQAKMAVTFAHNVGITPVLRLCVQDSCGFTDPDTLIRFLQELNTVVSSGNVVYVVAGPNEPATEGWLAPECVEEIAEPYDAEEYVDCNDIRNPEFHSLRPYPASPCKMEPEVSAALCADDLVARFKYTFQKGEGVCANNSDGSQTCAYNVVSQTDLTLGVSGAELPILGNTEDVPNSTSATNRIDYATRMNEYVSWYLNGITHRAEEPFNGGTVTPTPNTIYQLINLSGPIKKLFPVEIQENLLNQQIEDAASTKLESILNIRHNQIVVCRSYGSIVPSPCYRSGGERVVRLVRDNDADAVGNTGGGGRDFTNFYFPYVPASSTEDRVGALMLNPRGYSMAADAGTEVSNLLFTPNQEFLNTDPNLPSPYRNLYFAHNEETDQLGDILQRTFVPGGFPKISLADPQYGVDAQMASEFCQPVDEPVNNPGDSLYGNLQRDGGEPVQGALSFEASFVCEFPPPQVDESLYNNCMFNNQTNPLPPAGYATWHDYCVEQATTSGPTECTREIHVPMQVQTTFPYGRSLWSRFVFGDMSIFRRMFPRVEEGAPIDEIKDIPGETNVTYDTGSDQNNSAIDGVSSGSLSVSAIAGGLSGPNTGKLYFPHLGSIHQYFLQGIQCALRPHGLCGNSEFSSNIVQTPTDAICSVENSGIQSQELLNIIAQASRWANIPVELLVTVVRGEGCGGGNRTGGICQYTDEQVLQYSAPGATDPRNCPPIPGVSKGPMQIYDDSVNWGTWRNAVNMATGENRTPNICNIKDAIYAGAYILSASYDGCANPGHNVSSVLPWSDDKTKNALTGWAMGCSVPQCSGDVGSQYCRWYDDWSGQIQTDCN